jgi:hypothetical protein
MPTHRRAVRQKRPAYLCAAPSLFVPTPNGLSVFCQQTTAPRQSATRHRIVGSLSCGNLREPAIHGVAINHRQPAVAAFAATVRRSKSFVARSQASRPSPPMWTAIALSPGIIDALPIMRVAKLVRGLSFGRPGSTGAEKWVQNAANRSVKWSIAMQRPSIGNETQAFVFSTPSTTRTSLTNGSSGTPLLRIASATPYGRPLT